jgi:hypothetical protein
MNQFAAPGISGWTAALFSLAFEDKEAPFAKFIVMLTQQIANGTAPGRYFLTASRLTPLDKNPGVRPIAVGELFYRVAAKTIFDNVFTDNMLDANQLGVKSPGGVEPIVHMVAMARDGVLYDRSYSKVTLLDFKNAFNQVGRASIAAEVRSSCPELFRLAKWAYNERSLLLTRGPEGQERLWSEQGVRQGDPLGPFLFSLAFRPHLQELQQVLGDRALVSAYLDDGCILSREDVLPEVQELFASKVADGFILRPDKCNVMDGSSPGKNKTRVTAD